MFFSTYCDGEDVRIPALCPELVVDEWNAVGWILVKGYMEHKVFPMKLATAFFVALLFGEEQVTPDVLLSSFMRYLCDADRSAVHSSLDGSLTEDEKETFPHSYWQLLTSETRVKYLAFH